MFNVMLISHGSLAKGMLEACELIAGEQKNITTYGLNLGDDIETFREMIWEESNKLCDENGLLVLTDLQSGSPFNATIGIMDNPLIRHFTGMNMPMVLTVLCERNFKTLNEVCLTLLESSKKTMIDVNQYLKDMENIDEEE